MGCDGKPEIDLRSKMTFSPQRGATDCNIRCRIIMEPLSVHAENPTGADNTSYYQTAIENSSHTQLVLNQTNFENGVKYIDKSLEAGHPVLVGVNHALNFGYNEQTNTTDHYVIIVGKLCENGEVKYRFWDVGTRKGASEDYKFTLMKDKLFTDRTRKSGHDYTVTQIRRNINNSTGRLITF
ncbi:hypothetical protein SAMN05421825_3749 [Epilithonimonas hungarica]|uniref:Peptidase C39-like domain-containing protein n=2 Tax=Epilithonimonas hungarica TaxID=454006 RepID=A0A1G7VXY5_9FLAO|nr:hypothetical protein SAMN05421825_3749 [Epilithonimonas hungarica]